MRIFLNVLNEIRARGALGWIVARRLRHHRSSQSEQLASFTKNLLQAIRTCRLNSIGWQNSVLRNARCISDHVSNPAEILALQALDSSGCFLRQSGSDGIAP